MKGAPSSSTVEKIAAIASARRNAWKDEGIGAVAAPGAERARHRGGDAGAHAAVGRLQDHHHPGKRQRGAGERIGSDPPEKESVERDHAGERQQSEDVRRRQAQQRLQNRALEQQLGARRRGRRRSGLLGRQ
jgi:hypothetical protein